MLDIQEASTSASSAANSIHGNKEEEEETIQQSIINVDSGVQRRPRLASHDYDGSKERKRPKR